MFRIMKTHEFEDMIFYRAACECNDENHDIELQLTIDDIGIMSLVIQGKLKTKAHWHYYNIFERAWLRVKYSMILLFRGWFHLHHDFMITEERQIDSFVNALNDGKKHLNEQINKAYREKVKKELERDKGVCSVKPIEEAVKQHNESYAQTVYNNKD